jgi:transaldolase
MKFFLDTASLVEIQEIGRMGILDGIAIDASLVTEQGSNHYPAIQEICHYADRSISVEVSKKKQW